MNTHPTSPPNEVFGLQVKRLLLPINLCRCSLASFALANRLTKAFDSEVTLLHVFAREPTEDRKRQARHCLQRLGRDQLRSEVDWAAHVGVGNIGETILAEAAAARAEMILLPTFGPTWWQRTFGVGCGYGATTRQVIGQDAGRVFVVEVEKPFDCLRRWAETESPQWRPA